MKHIVLVTVPWGSRFVVVSVGVLTIREEGRGKESLLQFLTAKDAGAASWRKMRSPR